MGRRWLRPRTPVRSWGFTPNPTSLLKKACAKTLLVSTQLLRRDPPLGHARRRLVLRGHAPRLESPGTGRGRALAVSTGAAVAAGLGCRLGRCLTVPTGHQHPIARIVQSGHGPRPLGKYKISNSLFPGHSIKQGDPGPGRGLPPGAAPPGRRWRRFAASSGTGRPS